MSQQQTLARSIGLTVAMMTASVLLLAAAVVSLAAHAPLAAGVLFVLMIGCGVAGLASSVVSRNRSRAVARTRQAGLPGRLP